MPQYTLELKPQAERQLDKIRGQDYQRIMAVLEGLKEDPLPRGVVKLSGNYDPPLWRIRAGNYRVIYNIDTERARVVVAKVARRTESTYRRLS